MCCVLHLLLLFHSAATRSNHVSYTMCLHVDSVLTFPLRSPVLYCTGTRTPRVCTVLCSVFCWTFGIIPSALWVAVKMMQLPCVHSQLLRA